MYKGYPTVFMWWLKKGLIGYFSFIWISDVSTIIVNISFSAGVDF